MGAVESADYEYAPPSPLHSTLFVVRNGRYEPQNLMPVLPRPDILDFDGFVMRRGGGNGYSSARPPEMKQAALLKNPVSVRRDSMKIGDHRGSSPAGASVLSFTFDAQRGGQLSVHLLVREIEQRLDGGDKVQEAKQIEGKTEENADGQADVKPAGKTKGKSKEYIPRSIELHPQEQEAVALELEWRSFSAGLGQSYVSPPVDFGRWPMDRLTFNPERPREIPIAIRMEPEPVPGEPSSVHYTYVSLQGGRPTFIDACSGDPGSLKSRASNQPLSSQVTAQKLQYGSECFVLHEVFGVSSKATDAEADSGNSDCIICLSEPRDTAVLPCRHMCFCSHCAGIVRLQCDRCPVCRQKVVSLLQFKHNQDSVIESLRGDGGANAHKTAGFGIGVNRTSLTTAPTMLGSTVAASVAAAAICQTPDIRPSSEHQSRTSITRSTSPDDELCLRGRRSSGEVAGACSSSASGVVGGAANGAANGVSGLHHLGEQLLEAERRLASAGSSSALYCPGSSSTAAVVAG